MSDVTLEPCPFCSHGAPYVWIYQNKVHLAGDTDWVVHCKTCNISLQRPAKAKVIAIWNRHRQSTQSSLAAENERLRAALGPFVRAFEDKREKYIKRYGQNPEIGAANFDAMPDEWGMENIGFTMGDYRAARAALKGE